ncbi:MAG: purine nucleoside permease [Opitutales bacterium]|nr:purine nucleoside permease [Opitutales bacterium]
MPPHKIKLLIVAKFEIGELGNGQTGEGELFYRHYFKKSESFEIRGLCAGDRLHVCGNAAMAVTREGKINAAGALSAILSDPRFDFSDTYILSIGCAGTDFETTVMGDVIIGSAVVDGDYGHLIAENGELKWFKIEAGDQHAFKKLHPPTVVRALQIAKSVPVSSTPKTRDFMRRFNPQLDREPQILTGTIFSSDNYWKGKVFHDLAKQITSAYPCPDPYKASEMEESAIAVTADKFALLERLIVIRVSVNLDEFMNGATAEKLWRSRNFSDNMNSEDNCEGADIFVPAMHNLFNVGRAVADAILAGTF